MHDYAMHKLWSYYDKCTIDQIHVLRVLFVTPEYSEVNERINNIGYLKELIDLIKRVQESIESLSTIIHLKTTKYNLLHIEMIDILAKMKGSIERRVFD